MWQKWLDTHFHIPICHNWSPLLGAQESSVAAPCDLGCESGSHVSKPHPPILCAMEFNKSCEFFSSLLRINHFKQNRSCSSPFCVHLTTFLLTQNSYLLSHKKFDFCSRWPNYLCNRKLKI